MKENILCQRRMRRLDGAGFRSPSGGFALVIVLAILVLLVVLAVGFISSAGIERAAASGYHASVSTRQLADTAVSLVQGQINVATTQGASVAWASQPGMVRTFNNSNGNLVSAYKLYSARSMIDSVVDLTADLPPSTWANDTAIWTDLNAPVEVNQVKNYPILDPSSTEPSSPYPPPEGFAINSAPGATSYQAAPMPVRWLYMLRDGQIVAPTETAGTTATIPGAAAANPIVGRIAFWTDDETSKVNINTASEGTYWDTPRAFTLQEQGFAKYQPAQREFQRYPGHPAMTSLSTVFPDLTPAQIFNLVPRVIGGGSSAGTAVASSALVPDSDRLYASVDELIFKPDRSASDGGLTKEQLDQAKFFLTTRSRAPEINLFNLPRIACWPIYPFDPAQPSGYVTAFDRLIAFCSTINGLPYYFQREDANSPTNDISIGRNLEIYSYLQHLTEESVPGFGGDFSTKYGDDRDQILTEIFDYIRSTNLNDDLLDPEKQFTAAQTQPTRGGQVIPTVFGQTKGFGRFFTVSEVGIHLICTADGVQPVSSGTTVYETGAATSNNPAVNLTLDAGTPLGPQERRVQAIFLLEYFCPMQGWRAIKNDFQIEIEGLDAFRLGTEDLGFPTSASATVTVNPGQAGRLWGGTMGPRIALAATGGPSPAAPARGRLPDDPNTGNPNALYPFVSTAVTVGTTGVASGAVGGTMVFTGGPIEIRIYPPGVARTASTLIQTINVDFPGGNFPIPRLRANNPAMWAFPAEGHDGLGGQKGRLWHVKHEENPGNPPAIYNTGPTHSTYFSQDDDVLETMYPAHGDYRLVAGRAIVDSSVFVKHRLWGARIASNFHEADASSVSFGTYGFDGGKYISGVSYPNQAKPDIPFDAPQTPEATGDWDLAVAALWDGAYINKPDEGNILNIATAVPYFDTFYVDKTPGPTFFSPNRIMPSPGMFGSLPTGVKGNKPWTTLLFRPQSGHPNYSTTIPDHLWLDLFWMPVVEPYAISEPFSTAGKINLNYQILPFTYIRRPTGLVAVLKSEKVGAIPNDQVNNYKDWIAAASATALKYRLDVNILGTLGTMQAKFDDGKIYKSASEICDIPIVPVGETAAGMPAFWTTHQLTGDNMKERVYTTLYPRLTTKSNTFTVHFRAQSLRQRPGSTIGTWSENTDLVTSEYRGATTIERFINPDAAIPDYAANPANISGMDQLDSFYNWRIIENRQFAP